MGTKYKIYAEQFPNNYIGLESTKFRVGIFPNNFLGTWLANSFCHKENTPTTTDFVNTFPQPTNRQRREALEVEILPKLNGKDDIFSNGSTDKLIQRSGHNKAEISKRSTVLLKWQPNGVTFFNKLPVPQGEDQGCRKC